MQKLLLFDIDGTLTEPMEKMSETMGNFLYDIKKSDNIEIGVVGGSDAEKAQKQLGSAYRTLFRHCFHENGCVYFKSGDLVHAEKLEDFLGEDTLNKLVSFILGKISTYDVPFRTGTFIERRSCMLNVSPVGRACSIKQREEFFAFDKVHRVRERLVKEIRNEFPDLQVEIAIGGMISIDIFPCGLNKTHALEFLPIHDDVEIHFFGDRTDAGGNDHEIYNDGRVIGHHVENPEDTIRQVKELL